MKEEMFYHIVSMAVRAGVSPVKLAMELGTSTSNIRDWLEKTNAPHPTMRSVVYGTISKFVRENPKVALRIEDFLCTFDHEPLGAPSLAPEQFVVNEKYYTYVELPGWLYEKGEVGEEIELPRFSVLLYVGWTRGFHCVQVLNMNDQPLVLVAEMPPSSNIDVYRPARGGGWG